MTQRERNGLANLFVGLIFGSMSGAVVAAIWTRDADFDTFVKEQAAEREDRCCTHETRPCVFGPSIVGVQVCGFGSRWSEAKCEPDPKYRAADTQEAL